MVNAIVSIPGYVHLYRSLLRFYDMPENEVREMLYLLNTANLDYLLFAANITFIYDMSRYKSENFLIPFI